MAARFETERDGRVLVVRFEHPPRNFMDRVMVAELTDLVREVARDRTLGAVVLTGKPHDLFVTHYDVSELLANAEQSAFELSPLTAKASYRALAGLARVPGVDGALRRTPAAGVLDLTAIQALFRRIERLDKAVVAAVNGQALSIGCELALACDIRYMADDARAIGLPEITLGILPGAGGGQRLARTVGQLLDEALATAHRLARRAPISVAAAKRAVLDGASRPLDDGLAVERNWFMAALSRPAARRGLRRYVEETGRIGHAPWEDAGERERWQEGTAVDLLADDD
jgi:enoyl-CoA hydratase/carnithine racemase